MRKNPTVFITKSASKMSAVFL